MQVVFELKVTDSVLHNTLMRATYWATQENLKRYGKHPHRVLVKYLIKVAGTQDMTLPWFKVMYGESKRSTLPIAKKFGFLAKKGNGKSATSNARKKCDIHCKKNYPTLNLT